jgi:hypothetical protein
MRLFKAFILFFIATILFVVLSIVAIFVQSALTVWHWTWQPLKDFFGGLYDGLVFLFYQVAVTIDKSGARVLAPVLNIIFINSQTNHLFGSKDEKDHYYTISTILGLNYLDGTLTGFGSWFKEFLDLFEKDHIIKSV